MLRNLHHHHSTSCNKNGLYVFHEAGLLVISKYARIALFVRRAGFCGGTKTDTEPVREDISDMFSRSEFILAPTYKTYLDVLKYIDMAGIKHRRENDTTPRRPMTSVRSSFCDGVRR